MMKEKSLILHATHDIAALIDVCEDGRFRYHSINWEYSKVTGLSEKEVIGKTPEEVYGQAHGKLLASYYESCVRKRDVVDYTGAINIVVDIRNVETRLTPIIEDGKVMQVLSCARDITEHKRVKAQSDEQKKYLETLFRNSSDGIVLFDKEHRIVDINNSFEEIFGYKIAEIKGMNVDDVVSKGNTKKEAEQITEEVMKGSEVSTEGIRYSQQGEKKHLKIKGILVKIDGNPRGGFGIYTDITRQKESEAVLRHLSYHDKLTGLYNRAYFEEEYMRLDKPFNLPMTIMIGDVDHLKVANDGFGHFVGDELLIRIGKILQKSCRKKDVVARWGGDEFAIILPHTDKEQAQQVLCRIKKNCQEDNFEVVRPSISMGMAVKEKPEESLNSLIQQAEEEMYRTKVSKVRKEKPKDGRRVKATRISQRKKTN